MVKVKLTLEQAMKAQKCRRTIVQLSLTSALELRRFTPGKENRYPFYRRPDVP
jgi:hypothetical protein